MKSTVEPSKWLHKLADSYSYIRMLNKFDYNYKLCCWVFEEIVVKLFLNLKVCAHCETVILLLLFFVFSFFYYGVKLKLFNKRQQEMLINISLTSSSVIYEIIDWCTSMFL